MTWFVRNLREMAWWDRGPRGFVADLVGDDEAQVGVNFFVLGPGQPMSMYHWDANQEGFLVLSGEALLLVEGEEHSLRRWDYFHCPRNVSHTIVGAGSGPAAILALGARAIDENSLGYPYSEVAMKHDASTEEDTTDPSVSVARFPQRQPGEFSEAWLPR